MGNLCDPLPPPPLTFFCKFTECNDCDALICCFFISSLISASSIKYVAINGSDFDASFNEEVGTLNVNVVLVVLLLCELRGRGDASSAHNMNSSEVLESRKFRVGNDVTA